MKALIKVPFITPSNRSTTMDALLEQIDDVSIVYFPTQSIHVLYNITQYELKYIINNIESTIYIDPYDLLACIEKKHKDNLYYECQYIDTLPIVDEYPIQFEMTCTILGETPDWLDGTGTGILQKDNSNTLTIHHDTDNIYVSLDDNYRNEIISYFK